MSSAKHYLSPSASDAGGKLAVQAGSSRPTHEVDTIGLPHVCTSHVGKARQEGYAMMLVAN